MRDIISRSGYHKVDNIFEDNDAYLGLGYLERIEVLGRKKFRIGHLLLADGHFLGLIMIMNKAISEYKFHSLTKAGMLFERDCV
jgi:hypothetical protein